jgi:uncharacterized protein YeaO (DUF488 family)
VAELVASPKLDFRRVDRWMNAPALRSDLMTQRDDLRDFKSVSMRMEFSVHTGVNAGGVKLMRKSIPAENVRLKRAYTLADVQDGTRILVDRLWPRGVRKDAAAIDYWAKEIAPSAELRKWFGHDPERWKQFRRRYAAELRRRSAELDRLRVLARQGPITLVYGARDEVHNDAAVLRDVLLGRRHS